MASHVDDTWKTMWVTHGNPCGCHMGSHVSQCMAKACMCHNTWKRHACVTHGMPCVNMHGSFEAYIRGFTWAVLTSKGGSKLLSMGAARRRRRKGEEKGRKGKKKGKKKREEEMGGREEKERGKGRSVAQ